MATGIAQNPSLPQTLHNQERNTINYSDACATNSSPHVWVFKQHLNRTRRFNAGSQKWLRAKVRVLGHARLGRLGRLRTCPACTTSGAPRVSRYPGPPPPRSVPLSQVLDTVTGRWKQIRGPHLGHQGPSASCVVQGLWLVFGGRGSVRCCEAEALHGAPADMQWRRLPRPRHFRPHTAVAWDGKAVVFSGDSTVEDVLVYDPVETTWAELPGSHGAFVAGEFPSAALAAHVVNGALVVVGVGEEQWAMRQYCAATGRWVRLPLPAQPAASWACSGCCFVEVEAYRVPKLNPCSYEHGYLCHRCLGAED